MQRFFRSYAAPGVIGFFVQLIAAFVIGLASGARHTGSSAADPLAVAFEALGITAFLVVIGYTLRVIAYARLDRAAISSRTLWWGIVVAEAAYVAMSAWIAWVATEPTADAGFAWLLAWYLSAIVTIASVVIVIVAIIVTRRRKAGALAH